jgi:hypothetical protein
MMRSSGIDDPCRLGGGCFANSAWCLLRAVKMNAVGSDVAWEPALVASFIVVSSGVVSSRTAVSSALSALLSYHTHAHDDLRFVNKAQRQSMRLQSRPRQPLSLHPIKYHPKFVEIWEAGLVD